MQFEDMAEFELRIQLDRLRYIDALLNKRTYCDFPPRKLYIEPTNVCNLRCVHCVHNGALKRKPSFIDFELYKDIVDQISHLRLHTKLQFTGVGEPFLHKRIFDMIRYAADKGFFTLMNTNATVITEKNADRLIDSGLDYIHVSLDGVTKETYESIRVGGKFYEVIENIFNLFESKYRKNGYHLAVILGIIDQEKNRKEMELFFNYFEQYPFHHVVSGELFNHMGEIEEANKMYEDKSGLPIEEYPLCNTPWDLLSINSDGKAVGCNYDFDNKYVVGNSREEEILDIWNNSRMQKFRKALLDRNYQAIEEKGPLCSECTIKWQKDYHAPHEFHAEISRMEEYLTRAIRRSAFHKERNDKFREKEKYILGNKYGLISQLRKIRNKKT